MGQEIKQSCLRSGKLTEMLAGSPVKQIETSIPQRGFGVAAGVGKVEPDGLGSWNSDGDQDLIEIIGSEGLVPRAGEQPNRRCDCRHGHHKQTMDHWGWETHGIVFCRGCNSCLEPSMCT